MDSPDSGSIVSLQRAPIGDSFAGYATYFWYLYKRNLYTDVVFDLAAPEGPVTLSAHKMVLSIWSPYLADKFYKRDGSTDGIDATVNIIKLKDVSPEAFKAMIRFMYGHSIGDLDLRKACDLYKLAVQFRVQRLATLCLQHLNSVTIDASNVFDVLEASGLMRSSGALADRCRRFLQDRTQEVLERHDPSALSPSMLHTLLDLPELGLPGEFELLLWLTAWAKGRCLEGAECERPRDALEEFLPKVQPLRLSNEEFATLYAHHPGVFTAEEALAVLVNIGAPGSAPMPPWHDARRPVRKYPGTKR